MKIRILGCATSTGVPIVGCNCHVCMSDNPRNKRTRSSAFIETHNTNILIDSSTDLRFQALSNNITHIDAVLYTHSHADHTHGIDDLRTFNFINKTSIDCFGNEMTVDNIRTNFRYIFQNLPVFGGKPKLNFSVVDNNFSINGQEIVPVEIEHASWNIFGYRIGNFAYLTDCSGIPDASMGKLEGLELLVLGALRYRPHKAHFTVEEAVEQIERISPKHAILTHMGHELEYEELNSSLPDYIQPGYDGLEFNIED